MSTYEEWLDELIADRDETGVPITRREYYEKFFNNIDTKRVYEQDVVVTSRLKERRVIVDS